MFDTSRSSAQSWDERHHLKSFRDEFTLPKANCDKIIYLAGHSLGPMPKNCPLFIQRELEKWKKWGVLGHSEASNPWVSYHELSSKPIASIVGAHPSEVVVMNTLTVNLHLALTSFYRPSKQRSKILIEEHTFPSDKYAVDSQVKLHGFDPQKCVITIPCEKNSLTTSEQTILDTIEKHADTLALIMLGNANYLSGQVFPTRKIVQAAQKHGIIVGLNLAHGAGNIELNLHDWGVDFAVWCHYKYLCSGPGGMAGLFVHQKHHQSDLPRLEGWWGHDKKQRFKMGPIFEAIGGAESWQLSNPPIFQLAAVNAALDIFERAGMKNILQKSKHITDYLEYLLLSECGDHVEIISPACARGSMLSLRFNKHSNDVLSDLLQKGVICDFREPDILRVTPMPLYTRYLDVHDFVQILKQSLSQKKTPKKSSPIDHAVVGAGPVGCMQAIFLAAEDQRVSLFERRQDMRTFSRPQGRSINLVITKRGIEAFKQVGLDQKIVQNTIKVYGRMIHSVEGKLTYQSYSKDNSKCNFSISRFDLNKILLTEAQNRGVEIHFEHQLSSADFEKDLLHFLGQNSVLAKYIYGADGAGSAMRNELIKITKGKVETQWAPVKYKELTIPPQQGQQAKLAMNALHIWPRGEHFLMALPNFDHSFTATLYLPSKGEISFENISGPKELLNYFNQFYPDTLDLFPNLVDNFFDNPTGDLGTIKCSPWHYKNKAILLGDAGHPILPFFGQGLNSGLEDCQILASIGKKNSHGHFKEFFETQKPNADAIAQMAYENFIEMSSKVADDRFLLRKEVEHKLASSFSSQYRDRYELVVHTTTPYQKALQIGDSNDKLLDTLCNNLESIDQLDLKKAKKLLNRQKVG